MKKWKIYLLSLIAMFGFFACSDDDSFAPPVIDGPGSLTVEVHRDTADVYKIYLPVTSEKGLAKITLIDDASAKELDKKTSFTDAKAYTYEYALDLTSYTANAAVLLTLNIEDLSGQKASQKITVNVKKFSELDVQFAAEKMVSLFEDYNVKVVVKRGMIPLKEVQVFVGGNLSSTYDLSLDPEQSKYDLNLPVNGLVMGDNTVKIIVVDEKDQKFEKSITLSRQAVKTLQDISRVDIREYFEFNVNGALCDSGDPAPGKDKLYRIGGTPDGGYIYYYLNFAYAANGKVSQMEYSKYVIDEDTYEYAQDEKIVYAYEYNEDKELTKVTRKVSMENPTDYITDVKYVSGNIESYKLSGKLVMSTYLEKEGEMIRVDYLDKNMSGYTYGLTEKKYSNPLYTPALPAVVPGDMEGFMYNMLYNRYLFDGLKNGNTELFKYTVGDIKENNLWSDIQEITWTEGEESKFFNFYFKK